MLIGGLQKTSLLDYPGQVSAIIWTSGCNFSCPFCYNKDLISSKKTKHSEKEILDFLEKRKGLLDALAITGGEPFMQKDIEEFLTKVKKLGYLIKVDTNGMFPSELEDALDAKLIDYVAMDVKAPKKKYNMLAGKKVDIKKIQKSIDILRQKAPDYEFRTTVIPGLLEKKDIIEIAKWLDGSKNYFLQQFKHNVAIVDEALKQEKSYSKEDLIEILENIKPYFVNCDIRGI
jgi:pyruvate formate lyase activating enzyme